MKKLVFSILLIICTLLSSCSIAESEVSYSQKEPAYSNDLSNDDTTSNSHIFTTTPSSSIELAQTEKNQMAIQAVLDLLGTSGGTQIVEIDGYRSIGNREYSVVHVYSISSSRMHTKSWCWVDLQTGDVYDGLQSDENKLITLPAQNVVPDNHVTVNNITYDLNRVCPVWVSDEVYNRERQIFNDWHQQSSNSSVEKVYIGIRDLDYDGHEEMVVFAPDTDLINGILYVIGFNKNEILWYSSHSFMCEDTMPQIAAITSSKYPDVLLLNDFAWDWYAEKVNI